MKEGHVAVIDVGKTNVKLALVDLRTFEEIALLSRPNAVLAAPPWPHFDVAGHWRFTLDGLKRFHEEHGVDAITATTHGAAVALVGADGKLAAPVLDYEHAGPEETKAEYDAIRPAFADTGSPRLGMGLNVGAQLHWQFSVMPGLLDRTRHVMTYPQYWTYRLSGRPATEVTSLGAHTDLWLPGERRFSGLADRLGIADKIAPVRAASDVLGPVLEDVADVTGIARSTPVYCGIHDSNASLLPHLASREAPFSVVSTGTWIIAMAVGGGDGALDPARDTLVNVNAFGDPVPSAKFMGGREYEISTGGPCPAARIQDMADVLSRGIMLLPSVAPEVGPYPGRAARWIGGEPEARTAAREAAVAFYLGLVTGTCLELAGHRGPVVVEGPFAANRAFCLMLGASTGSEIQPVQGMTGTSRGAALLAGSLEGRPPMQSSTLPREPALEAMMTAYADRWRSLARAPT